MLYLVKTSMCLLHKAIQFKFQLPSVKYHLHVYVSTYLFVLVGLDYNYCIHKMRLLTLTSLAVESSEVSFSVLCSELNLPREEVEMVVLEGWYPATATYTASSL